ncbi:DMT family transporter [Pseudomonas sp. App30]|uniref:DMT family transporter n=1 Tax=Pseudomonas sp. App30 TaxID=3068990 RepID=UPI003A80D6D3
MSPSLGVSSTSTVGIAAALFAALTWSMNFVAPLVIGDFTIYDLAACRFIISGLIGVSILAIRSKGVRGLVLQDWVAAAAIGFIGYVGYFMAVMIAATYAGPVIAPAFLGLVPVILAISGNLGGGTLWRYLYLPFGMAATGLILVNVQTLTLPVHTPISTLLLGVAASISAVALWTWFGLANQKALARRPSMDAWVWTALMMIGGSVQTLVAIPLGMQLGVFTIGEAGLHLDINTATHLLLPAAMLAVVASILGAGAWTIASQRLPITLASQLLSMEMVFATCLGLAFHHRYPTVPEAIGIGLIVLGVVKGVGAFSRKRPEGCALVGVTHVDRVQ